MASIGINIQGLCIDIEEDDGYERMDLVMTVLDNIVTDVMDCTKTEDKDKLYALAKLISCCNDYLLMAYLPKDSNRSPYDSEYVGEFRVEGSTTINVSDFVSLEKQLADSAIATATITAEGTTIKWADGTVEELEETELDDGAEENWL